MRLQNKYKIKYEVILNLIIFNLIKYKLNFNFN